MMKNYNFIPMTLEYANKIKDWKYNGFMKTIYMDPYFENYNDETKEMKGPGGCDGYAVLMDNQLFGLFEYYFLEDKKIEIGLAINPIYVGKGLSKEFIEEGIKFCVNKYNYREDIIKLTVEIENISAYKAYIKAGFIEIKRNENEIFMIYKLRK